MITFITPHI